MLTTIDYASGSTSGNYIVNDQKSGYVNPNYVPDSVSIANDDTTDSLTIQAMDYELATGDVTRYCTPAITVKAGETLDISFGSFRKLQIVGSSVPWRLQVKAEI